MNEAKREAIQDAISHAPGMYSRLILLVGPTRSGKTQALQEISGKYDKNIINVNLEMSKILMEIPIPRRESRAGRVFDDIIKGCLGDTASEKLVFGKLVFLDNLEILFDKDLKQDPLFLLQSVSRNTNTTIVASWNGTWSNNKPGKARQLIFAVSGHQEYRFYDNIDAQIISFEKECVGGLKAL
ncbi:ATPase AAA [Spirochaetia bacterium]|nr:ATPase AAA [Spirochaetia bacterium]